VEKENFDSLKKEILTVWKGKFWQFGKGILTVWKGKFWQFGKGNFDSLEREILTVWKRKFWQFGKGNFDSLEKEILTVWKREILTVWKGNFLTSIKSHISKPSNTKKLRYSNPKFINLFVNISGLERFRAFNQKNDLINLGFSKKNFCWRIILENPQRKSMAKKRFKI
jgi:hypothetical protein